MARTIAEIQLSIVKEEGIVKRSTSQLTRNLARERISYLRGELALARDRAREVLTESVCPTCCGDYYSHIHYPRSGSVSGAQHRWCNE